MHSRILLFIVLFAINLVYASSVCQTDTGKGGILDNLLTQFAVLGDKWQREINPLAKKMFFILFTMEFLWQLVIKRVFAGDMEKLWMFFFTRVTLCFFFAKYLVDVNLYKGIIVYMSSLGSRLSGFNLDISSSVPIKVLGPSAILGYSSCVADMVEKVTTQSDILGNLTSKLILAITEVMVFIVLIFIAFYVMVTILQAYALFYVGFILVGFAGSSWTRDYWHRYFATTISIGIKFMVVCFLLGVFQGQFQNWSTQISGITNMADAVKVIFAVFGTSLMFFLVLMKLPEWLATVLSGQIYNAPSSSGFLKMIVPNPVNILNNANLKQSSTFTGMSGMNHLKTVNFKSNKTNNLFGRNNEKNKS